MRYEYIWSKIWQVYDNAPEKTVKHTKTTTGSVSAFSLDPKKRVF